jgi:glycerol-3-phosphate acyltransferase PlsX
VVAASEVVAMDDPVEVALRKKDSSMRVAIQQVKDGAAQAAVSAGNTGALMAIARYLLKTLDGIDRPAIATQMPNAKGGATTVLDLGANVDCTAEHLLQFAVMGSALVSVLKNARRPSACSISAKKPSRAAKSSSAPASCCAQPASRPELLRQRRRQRHLQGHGGHRGVRWFVGNVALKTTEGVASMIGGLKEEFKRNIFTKIAAIMAYPVLSALMKRMDHRRYNGAALLGLRGLVFKSHGSADAGFRAGFEPRV